MDTIAYGDLRIEMLAEYGGKIERGAQQVMPKIGLNPRTPAPGELNVLLGRDAEIAAANAATAGEPIEFYAGCGFGKSALLRQVAAQLRARTAVPVVYMRVGRHLADDLWPRLVETLYTADRPFVPTPEQRAQLLAQARATILLDDVTLGPGEVGEILGNLPQCAVVLGCDRPVIGVHQCDGRPAAPLLNECRLPVADPSYSAERKYYELDRLIVASLAEGQR